MSGLPSSYRDRIYIIKDLILKLVEYGEMNQTALISFCGLNLKKHKSVLCQLKLNGLVIRNEIRDGKRNVIIVRHGILDGTTWQRRARAIWLNIKEIFHRSDWGGRICFVNVTYDL
jgi:predicted transcriptional regulator